MNRRNMLISSSSALAGVLLAAPSAWAKSQFPDHPIKLIVPFPPGGVVDAIGRLWADRISAVLGSMFVENHGGATGGIGATEVARAQPDGYTLLLGNTSTQVLTPLLKSVPYNPEKDFAAIGIIATSTIALIVNPSVPATNLKELIAYIKNKQGKVFYGAAGIGSYSHLAGEMFKDRAGTPGVTVVPYKGGGPAIRDVVAGQIPMAFVNITGQVLALQRSGALRIIAVLSPQRLSNLPNLPTAAAMFPGLVAGLSIGVFAPAATPAAIIDRIARAHAKVMANEEFEQRLRTAGFEPVRDTPKEAQQFLDTERTRIAALVKSLGFKLK